MKTPPALRRLAQYLWREWVRPLALPLLIVGAAKSALADINYVPTGSMKPTILEGDVVFIDKLAYDLRVPFTFARVAHWADPARGDIVVCFAPDDGTRLVKRVAGLPGDTVELRGDVLFINGVRQNYAPLARDSGVLRDLPASERAAAVFARENLSGRPHAVMALPALPALRDFGPVRVPAGEYLMLGDNRDNSRDSRFFGFMPREKIIGEAKWIIASGDLDHWLRPRFDRFFSRLE
ncbi:MAG TPA: signal peptidase I [Opitutaceae bacterium]|nr:signal peptidase I [Opitutaceae bacterium]